VATTGGQPGNQNAAKSKAFHDSMRKACVTEDYARIRKGVERILDAVAEGEEWAIVFARDTLDGRPKQQTEITGEDGGPIFIKTGIDRMLAEVAESADR